MKIDVERSITVTPTEATPNVNLWISNLDQLYSINYHTLTVYFYRPNGSADFFNTAALTAALGRVLVPFYPFAGRLRRDSDGRVEICCNGEGVLFVEAVSDASIDDFGDFTPSLETMRLIPPVDYSKGMHTFPVLVLQVTKFKCGGVSLGAGVQHHVTDGVLFIHFMNTWSEVVRGLDITVPPLSDRSLLRARNPPQPKFNHLEYQPPPSMLKQQQQTNSSNSKFKFNRDQINYIKAKSKLKEDNTGGGITYTTYEILAAYIWRCATIARDLPKEQETKLHISVDGRARLRPPLPEGYFGNVVFKAAPIALAGELKARPLWYAVNKIHDALNRMDDEYLRSAIDYLENQPDISKIMHGTRSYVCPNLGLTSWTTLRVYDADFGWGRPVYMGPGQIPREGHGHLLPSPTNDGSVSLSISLYEDHMKVFEKLLHDDMRVSKM